MRHCRFIYCYKTFRFTQIYFVDSYFVESNMITSPILPLQILSLHFHILSAEVINNNIKRIKEDDLRHTSNLQDYLMLLLCQASWFWLIKCVAWSTQSNLSRHEFTYQARHLYFRKAIFSEKIIYEYYVDKIILTSINLVHTCIIYSCILIDLHNLSYMLNIRTVIYTVKNKH